MCNESRFKLIFSKLQEVLQTDKEQGEPAKVTILTSLDVTTEELNEIEELRRVVMEISDPEPQFFTTT